MEAARRAGIHNLSLDLIYGLPGQSMESWRKTVERALDLGPEHLSCYGLKLDSDENMVKLGKEIEGAKAYFLQGYQESGGVISPGFHSCTKMEMEKKAALVRRFVSNVQLRGVE